MPVTLQCSDLPLSGSEAARLWKGVLTLRQFSDDQVTVRCVSEQEIQELNRNHRGKDAPTNVLTFSYEQEHDIALCLPVARREAAERNISEREFAALLLVHAFLHAAGMDHDRGEQDAEQQSKAEQDILDKAGFPPVHL